MNRPIVHREISNIGLATHRRSFPGFPKNTDVICKVLDPREALCLKMDNGDLLLLESTNSDAHLQLLIFNTNGELAPELLGLRAEDHVELTEFDNAELAGWLGANGVEIQERYQTAKIEIQDLVTLKAGGLCHVWAINPLSPAQLVERASPGSVEIRVKPSTSGNSSPLPPELGTVRDEFTVRRGTAMAYELAPGEIVQIIDIEGQQCSDFIALRLDGLNRGEEMTIDSTATRSMVRGAYPHPGLFDKFYDQDMQPLMTVLQDTCGRHDTFGLACNARGYEERGFPGHLNCSDNISDALDPYGVRPRAAWPAINFFWNTWIEADGQQLLSEESYSRPGDYVALRAMEPLLCASTACPDDLDPINGWNPTDVHVRIYKEHSPIRRAVAYRQKEDAPMSISQESAFHPSTSKLTNHYAPARDLWMPVAFPTVGTIGEYWACREKVALQDMSSLRKYDIIGPDAERLLQIALTRNVSKLSVWRGTYALMCDEAGTVIDDGTLFRLGHELFRWCCGSEESARVLSDLAESRNLQARIHGMGSALPSVALQGPASRDVLKTLVSTRPHVPSLEQLKWFGVTVARLNDRNGTPFMLTRSGYTGELGYELFCSRQDASALWDALMLAGEEFGIEPMGSAALEILRIESGLAAAGAEFAPGVDAYEAGLGFAIDLEKSEFTGKAALERNAREPRRKLIGLQFDCDDVPAHGAQVFVGERPVGAVTSATGSPKFERSIAMARIAVEHCEVGSTVEVGQMDGRMKRLGAVVSSIPFYDPKRERARA
ncbi:MAG: DUF1989 domain-containing protein [Pseudomonadota bacterium]